MALDTSSLIDLIYGTCHDHSQWREFCGALRDQFDGSYIAMHGHDAITGNTLGFLNTSYDEYHLKQYKSYYGAVNPWALKARALPVGVVHRSEEIIPHEDLLRTECYNDWIKPQENIATGAGVTLFRDANLFFRLSCNIRLRDRDRHQEDLVRVLTTLTPHMQHALSIARKFSGIPVSGEVEVALNLNASAIFLLSADGRAVFFNRAARRLLDTTQAVKLLGSGELSLADPQAQNHLVSAVRTLGDADADQIGATGDFNIASEHGRLRAAVAPFNAGGRQTFGFLDAVFHDAPLAMVIVDFERAISRDIGPRLKRDFHLTPAEIALAKALNNGDSLRDFAERHNKAHNTVKAQLKSIFMKLEVSRQAELVSYLSRLDTLDRTPSTVQA